MNSVFTLPGGHDLGLGKVMGKVGRQDWGPSPILWQAGIKDLGKNEIARTPLLANMIVEDVRTFYFMPHHSHPISYFMHPHS